MVEPSNRIAKRVVHALQDESDPTAVVQAYFDRDRAVVLEAVGQTLEATREEVPREKLETAVDRELIDELRFPVDMPRGLAVLLYLNRGKVAFASTLVAVATAAAFLLL